MGETRRGAWEGAPGETLPPRLGKNMYYSNVFSPNGEKYVLFGHVFPGLWGPSSLLTAWSAPSLRPQRSSGRRPFPKLSGCRGLHTPRRPWTFSARASKVKCIGRNCGPRSQVRRPQLRAQQGGARAARAPGSASLSQAPLRVSPRVLCEPLPNFPCEFLPSSPVSLSQAPL